MGDDGHRKNNLKELSFFLIDVSLQMSSEFLFSPQERNTKQRNNIWTSLTILRSHFFSIHHKTQDLSRSLKFFSGLFQASVVIAYTTYLTWSALSHEPDDLCNPPGYVISGYDQTTGLSLQGIFSSLFVFVMLVYASLSTAMSASNLSKFNN